MERVIASQSNKPQLTLAELASQINLEHGLVENAIEDGLAHARRAGELLRQAKATVPHGQWLVWVKANCKVTPRTAQRYMRLAERWGQITEGNGQELGLHSALQSLADGPKGASATSASHLPPALAYYRDLELINDDSMIQLTDLAEDYGPEIVTHVPLSTVEISPEDSYGLLDSIRPEAYPRPWPLLILRNPPAAIRKAVQIFCEDCRKRGDHLPQWEITAFWHASTMVHYVLAKSFERARCSSILHTRLGDWRSRFQTALVFVGKFGPALIRDDEKQSVWHGFRLDLLYGRVLAAAERLREDPAAHPNLTKSLEAGIRAAYEDNSFPLPTICQVGLVELTRDMIWPRDHSDSNPDHGGAKQ